MFFVCSCFYSKNYFVKEINAHVYFENAAEFTDRYRQVFQKKCIKEEAMDNIIRELEKEKERRFQLHRNSNLRRAEIRKCYQPLHHQIYSLKEEYLSDEFIKIVNYSKIDGASKKGLIEYMNIFPGQLYSFPVFKKSFCDMFIEEMKNFEQSDAPKGRPNTMNNYGILLDELGFDENLLKPLRENYISPISSLLFADVGGNTLDSHKAFVVTYEMARDKDLDYHYDNAEVTMNVSLGGKYEDGALYFGSMRDEDASNESYIEYKHQQTIGLIHRGQQRHGALPISDGARYNLIIWMRSSAVRNENCPMCDRKPELIETEGFGDGFTRPTVNVCSIE